MSKDVAPAGASRTAEHAKAPDGRRITEVAVGIIVRADGALLLGQRPDGKPYAGYWEFPGGKIEPGESVSAALARELHEELGLVAHSSVAWRVLEHDYPHAYVRLHFHKVIDWSGDPHGREGQAFAWTQLPVRLEPVLPATLPVLEWLAAEAAVPDAR